MNLVRCNNGHFYDADKFQQCPHCNEGNAGTGVLMDGGSGFNSDATVAYADNANDMTIGTGSDYDNSGFTVPSTDAAATNGFDTFFPTGSDSSMGGNPFGDPWGGPTGPSNIPTAGVVSPIQPTSSNNMSQTQPAFSKTNSSDLFAGLNTSKSDFIDGEDASDVTQRYNPLEIKSEPVVGWLVAINGENIGKSFELRTGKNFIGRGKDMDVVLTGDKSISRNKHAIILYEPRNSEFLVQPGESRELFYLNGNVVLNTERISSYDKIFIGSTELLFVPFCGDKFSWDEAKGIR